MLGLLLRVRCQGLPGWTRHELVLVVVYLDWASPVQELVTVVDCFLTLEFAGNHSSGATTFSAVAASEHLVAHERHILPEVVIEATREGLVHVVWIAGEELV